MEGKEDLIIGPPKAKKACTFGHWENQAPRPEDMPDMVFRCSATGYSGKMTGKSEGLCNKCILYVPKV